jgi:hypothetical protein
VSVSGGPGSEPGCPDISVSAKTILQQKGLQPKLEAFGFAETGNEDWFVTA